MRPTQVLATIRQMFWILHGPTEVRRVINNCVDCQKRNAKPGTQVMAPLPSVRITPMNPPFTFVGVDYFGPLMVRQGRSFVKRYGCLFTCLTMRAVHIEIAYSLDAESFLCAFSRFIARRGQPKEVYRVYKKKLNKPEIAHRLCKAPQCTKFFIEIGCLGTDNVV